MNSFQLQHFLCWAHYLCKNVLMKREMKQMIISVKVFEQQMCNFPYVSGFCSNELLLLAKKWFHFQSQKLLIIKTETQDDHS